MGESATPAKMATTITELTRAIDYSSATVESIFYLQVRLEQAKKRVPKGIEQLIEPSLGDSLFE